MDLDMNPSAQPSHAAGHAAGGGGSPAELEQAPPPATDQPAEKKAEVAPGENATAAESITGGHLMALGPLDKTGCNSECSRHDYL